MPAGTSLGSGIALQSGGRSDYWMRKLADDWAARRAAAAKAAQEKKKQAADNQKWFLGMLTVPEGMAPVMMDGAASLIEQAYTNAEGAFESGDLTSLHKIITDTKIGVNQIKRANDDMGKLLEDPNADLPPGLRVAWNQDGTKWDDLKIYANYLAKFPIFGENYSISIPETLPPYKPRLLERDTFELLNVDKSGKLVKPEARLSGTLTSVYKRREFVSQARKQEYFDELMKDPVWMQKTITKIIASKPDQDIPKYDLNRSINETPEQFLARNPDLAKQIEAVTWDFVNANSQGDIITPFTGTAPQPRESDEPSSILVVMSDKQTIPGKKWDDQGNVINWSGDGGIGANINLNPDFSFDARVSVSKAGTSTIPVTERMIKMNPELEGMTSIQFSPGELLRGIRPDGSYGWYSTGKVESFMTDDDEYLTEEQKQYKTTTLNPLIPYQDVLPMIIGPYPDINQVVSGSGGTRSAVGGSGAGDDIF